MNKKAAEWWVSTLDELLKGKRFVSVVVHPYERYRPQVRVNQEYEHAYIVEHGNGECVVGIGDSYGVLTGIEAFSIDPNKRTIQMEWSNAYGQTLTGAYTLMDPGDEWQLWRRKQEASWNL